MVLLVLLALAPGGAAAQGRYALIRAGDGCPGAGLAAAARNAARAQQLALMPGWRVATATARVRAARALTRARKLYTRANFAGCVSLLSITEQELGLQLADSQGGALLRAHQLLARVNLWLGICQWAAGDPQTAASSFVRSSQLPGSPVPDPRLLPPAVVRAYRASVVAPRQQVSCQLVPPLTPAQVQVNGKGPVVLKGRVLVPVGTHYLVLTLPPAQQTADRRDRLSLRLQASAPGCKVQLPPVATRGAAISCVNPKEASDPLFVAAVTGEAAAAGSLVVSQQNGRLAMRLLRQGRVEFERQLMVKVGPQKRPAEVIAHSMRLLLAGDPRPRTVTTTRENGWYTKWWIWALVGTAVVVTTTTAIVASKNDRVKVVFGP